MGFVYGLIIMMVFSFFSSIAFIAKTEPNSFTNGNKTRIKEVNNEELKPVIIKNVYTITLKVSDFINLENGISFKLITHGTDNQKITIANISNDNDNFFTQSVADTSKDLTIKFNHDGNHKNRGQVNFLYNVSGFSLDDDNNYIKDIKIVDFTDPNGVITITGDYPFNIILKNYKYNLKENYKGKQQYNQDYVIIGNNFFINKVN